MTDNEGMLKNLRPYLGIDSVLIGDGTSLAIKSFGDACAKNVNHVLPFNDVRHVPHLKKILLSRS